MSKFKVGDKVRIVESDNEYGHGFDVGSVIEVKRVRELWDGIDYECHGEGIAQTVRERDIEPCASDDTIQLNHQYTSKNGQKWECIAINGGIAWLASAGGEGDAYRFMTNGENLSQGGGAWDIKFEPVVEWVEVRGGFTTGSLENATVHPEYADHKFTLKVPFIDGKPDFAQSTVTPV